MSSAKIYKLPVEHQLPLFEVDDEKKPTRLPIGEQTYRVVGDEVLNEALDPETWAKALASGSRTREAALSVYAQLRSEELAEDNALAAAKRTALEERKRIAALSCKESRRITGRRDFSIGRDFFFWQSLLSISGIGLYLSLLGMQDGDVWWPGWLPILVMSFCLQLSPMVLYGVGRLLLGPVKYHRALGATAVIVVGLGALCATATFKGGRLPSWLRVETIAVNATNSATPKATASAAPLEGVEQEF